ncbi:MAG: response regulator transcription factor [Candidatus Latescibacterota bacterium]
MKKISLIVIDDNQLLREGITEIIEQQPDIEIMAAFGESGKALTKVCNLKPDVLLLDFGLSNQNSLLFMKSFIKKCPETKVIVMDVVPIQEAILQYVEAGVSGFILKDATSDDFLKTIRSVANEEKILPPNLTGSLFSQIVDNEVNQAETSKLIQTVCMTKREREIVLLIADGLTNKEIAQKLCLSAGKVKSHVHNIFEKMVLNTRIQFAIYAPPSEDINRIRGSIHPNDK